MPEHVIDDPLDVLDEQTAQARDLLRVQIVAGNRLSDVGVEVAHRVGEFVMLEE